MTERLIAKFNFKLILNTKNIIFLYIFFGLVFFELTAYKFIWGVETFSTFFNASFLGLISIYITFKLLTEKLNQNIWIFYLIPGFLVFFSYFLNISLNVYRDPGLLSFFSALLPWAVFLAIPFLIKDQIINSQKILTYYVYTLFLLMFFAVIEYFFLALGLTVFRLIETPNGLHLAGIFSIIHALEDGTPTFRFYGPIFEAGNTAMLVLPGLAYSIIYRKFFLASFFVVIIYLTASLGGIIGLIQLLILLPFVIRSFSSYRVTYRRLLFIFLYLLFFILVSFLLSSFVIELFEIRAGPASKSVDTRLNNFVSVIYYFPEMIISNPLGFEFSNLMSASKSEYFFGSNFALGVAAYYGGLLAVLGYLIVMSTFTFAAIKNIFANVVSRDTAIFSLSILLFLPFIIQRSGLFEHATLLLVFSPFIIEFLNRHESSNKYSSNKEIKHVGGVG